MSITKVVILNWNGEQHLRRFLPSVVAHTPPEVEIVVADNGSTDSSVELLRREFPTVTVLELGENYGFAGGYNVALSRIEADYFVLLNSDVKTPAGWLPPLVEELDSDPRVSAVAPKLLSYAEPTMFEYSGAAGGYIDYLGFPFCRGRIMRHIECDEGQYDDTRNVMWVSGAAFCCRADVFRSLGGFDSDYFAHMEEIDLCWRMQLVGYEVRIVPRSRVYHLGGGTLQTDSPHKLYLNYRNNLSMIIKCASPTQRLTCALVRPVLDMASAVVYLVLGNVGQFKATLRAYRDFFASHPTLLRKRRLTQQTATHRPKTIYGGSIIFRYFTHRRRFDSLM